MFRVLSEFTGEHDWRLVILAGIVCLLAGLIVASLFHRARGRARAAWLALPGAVDASIDAVEQKLRDRNIQIDTALNNMTQGLCMFDSSERIVVFNRRFLEMYKLSPVVVKAGCHLRELIAHRKDVGLLEGDPDTYYRGIIDGIRRGKSDSAITKTTDGRVIKALNQPMPGGGWVTTHEDITQQQIAEEQIGEQKLQFNAALNNMIQGVLMFDAQGTLILNNRRFLELYDLPDSALTPGKSKLEDLIALVTPLRKQGPDPKAMALHIMANVAGGRAVKLTTELLDGRCIAIENHPMADGGWIATHYDVTEKQRSEERLREQTRLLDTALSHMAQGLCVYNRDGYLALFNQRYLDLYGLPTESVRVGLTIADLMELRKAAGSFEGDTRRYIAELRTELANGRSFAAFYRTKDGRVISVVNRPMPDGGWVATHEDITERQEAAERLQEQKLRLDVALNNMSQGLLMFGSDGRLVTWNSRYLEIYKLPADSVRAGATLQDLLELRRATAVSQDDPKQYVRRLRSELGLGKQVAVHAELTDGRTILIENRPLPDGRWISTHTDITARKRAEERLREQKIQLDTALNNMSQGLNMFDASGRLVVCNDQYLRMYRLFPEVVRPGCSVEDLVRARMASGTFFTNADPTKYAAELMKAMHKREPMSATMELTDGRVVQLMSQSTTDGSGWVVTHEDITERRRTEQERDRSRIFANTVIENVPVPIIAKDARDLRYILINRAAEAFYGVPRDAMLGKTIEDVFPKQTADKLTQKDRNVLKLGKHHVQEEHPVITPGGATCIVTSNRIPISDPQGEAQYLLTVIEDRTHRRRAEAQIAHLSHHDALTGLPNRSAFNACIEATIENVTKDNQAFALLSLGIDRFKEINDVYGYAAGDEVLRALSKRIQSAVGGAFVARVGGDEFSVIATDGDQPAGAEQVAERLLAAIREDFIVGGRTVRTGITIGISVFPLDGRDAATLVANADAARSRAKSEGRGTFRFFEADMDKRLRDRRALQQDLRSAIERGELTLHYQPQAKISGEIIGFEALARWHHPLRGMISPATFIPLAEESGLIVPLGEWILREACRQAASWPKPLSIAINLSPVQFRHGDLPALVHSVLLETGLAPSRLELEITEGVLIGDFSRAVSILRRLKALGARIAMDDFGTGYSSLSYLHAFPFDKIKIDQTFISNLEDNEQSATIIRAVIGLARGLKLPVLAEGVETKEQFAFLAREDCDEIQGYLIGRPLPIEDHAALTGRQTKLRVVASAG